MVEDCLQNGTYLATQNSVIFAEEGSSQEESPKEIEKDVTVEQESSFDGVVSESEPAELEKSPVEDKLDSNEVGGPKEEVPLEDVKREVHFEPSSGDKDSVAKEETNCDNLDENVLIEVESEQVQESIINNSSNSETFVQSTGVLDTREENDDARCDDASGEESMCDQAINQEVVPEVQNNSVADRNSEGEDCAIVANHEIEIQHNQQVAANVSGDSSIILNTLSKGSDRETDCSIRGECLAKLYH